MANESKVILAEEHRYLHHIMEMTAGNATIKSVLLVLLCVIKNRAPNVTAPSPSVACPPTHSGLPLPLTNFPENHDARTLAHTHVPCTRPNSNSFTGTNPKQLYGSQLNHPSFLGKTEKTLARQIKLEMGQSQTPRSKTTQNSQCIWILVQILTVCYCFSLTLCHLPRPDKLFRLSPSITWCILSPSSTRDLHQSAHPCAPCGCLAHFLPRPSLT